MGSKASLSLKKKPAAASAVAPQADPKAWAVGGDEELMDDEELLTEEDKRPVAAPSESRVICIY